MSDQAYEMLIFTDAKDNNNKFYEVVLESDGNTVRTRWGRVGSEGQKGTSSGGKREFDRIVRAKTAKGYVKTNTVSINTGKSTDKVALAEAAKRDLLGDLANSKDKRSVTSRPQAVGLRVPTIATDGIRDSGKMPMQYNLLGTTAIVDTI